LRRILERTDHAKQWKGYCVTDGILIINKPAGITSHDVVARVRKLLGQKRVGHTGTLDPLATGVLPICIGQATRVAEYLSEGGKAYRATIRFGVETTTYDAEGEVVREASVALTPDEIKAVLPEFLGEQEQIPPIYSAIKRDGKPLYKLARAGEDVTPEPRHVRIDALDIIAWNSPDLTLDIECGKGTYIRSLAFDLGRRLGPGAYLAGLIRTRSGPFSLDQSVTLDELEAALAGENVRALLHPADEALADWGDVTLDEEGERRLRNGQALASPPQSITAGTAESELLRAYASDGRFLGILRWDGDTSVWRPHKVFVSAPAEE
jgi:tRNA pseudouridine55 synthase